MMERLTSKKEADAQRKAYERRLEQGYPRNIPEERFLRLSAYEDTGMTPEEVKYFLGEMMSQEEARARYEEYLNRQKEWREWKDAEEQGRLVVLPCKVGDTVYCISSNKKNIQQRVISGVTHPEFRTETEDGIRSYDLYYNDFGRFVFLTREEAEAALKETK